MDQGGIELALRLTALLAFPFLAVAYSTRRRPFWLAFAAIFAVHLALIVWLLSLPPDPGPPAGAIVVGAIAYLLLAGIVLDRGWTTLGEHWVFAVFTLTLAGAVATHGPEWLPLLAVAGATYWLRFSRSPGRSRPG
jgi:hypothetical protein